MKNFSLISSVLFICLYALVFEASQCQGAKYMNSLDLDDDQMSMLLDELSLPEHRIIKDREKSFSWFNLQSGGSRNRHVFSEREKAGSRARRRRQGGPGRRIFYDPKRRL